MVNTLFDYYAGQGQALPTLSARAQTYQTAGLGQANAYTGSADQNNALLSYLQAPKSNTNTPIDAASLTAGTTPITAPNAPVDTTNHSATVLSLDSGALSTPNLDSALTDTSGRAQVTSDQKALMGLEDQYNKKSQVQTQLEQNAGLPQFNAQLNDINSQIQTLQKQAQQATLTSEGRLAPTFAIQGEQAQIERQRSIQALGLSAIAQTLQGNIANARAQVDQAISLQFDPIQQQIDHQREVLKMNQDNLTASEKKRADIVNLQLNERQRLLDQQKQDKTIIMGWVAEAAKNGAPALLLQQGTQATDPQSALSILAPYFQDPNAKAKALADLQHTRAETAKIYADVAKQKSDSTPLSVAESKALGVPYGTTRAEAMAMGKVAGQATKDETAITDNLSLVNTILSKPNDFQLIFGAGKYNPANLISGLPSSYTKAQVDQLRAQLSLGARQLIKGSGAISDFESKTLQQAASALDANISPSDAEREMKKIRGVFQTELGLTPSVKLTDPKTGEVITGTATKAQIEQAIKDGINVEYQ